MAESFRYEQIARALQRNIKSGLFPSGKLPPERFLAEYFNVNRLTLRKAMKLLEAEKWIFRMGRRGTFIVKGDQFGGITKRRVFAYLLAGEDNFHSFYANSVAELSRQLSKVGGSLLLYTARSLEEIGPLEEATMGHAVDGIFVSGRMDLKLIEKLQSWDIPLVVLGHLLYRDPAEEKWDRVLLDSLDYAYRCTWCLIKEGAEKIVLVNGPSQQVFSDVTQGYMKALNEAGIDFREGRVVSCAYDNTETAEKSFTEWLKANNNDLDAVFAADESLQTGVRQALWNSECRKIMLTSISCGELNSSKGCLLFQVPVEKIAAAGISLMGKRLASKQKAPETVRITVTEI
jgi:DNA-binding LacI/PurR family transcriptional regulator